MDVVPRTARRIPERIRRLRGMTIWRDLEDWVGGLPFEVAKPQELFEFYQKRGFSLLHLRTTTAWVANEMVFRK